MKVSSLLLSMLLGRYWIENDDVASKSLTVRTAFDQSSFLKHTLLYVYVHSIMHNVLQDLHSVVG